MIEESIPVFANPVHNNKLQRGWQGRGERQNPDGIPAFLTVCAISGRTSSYSRVETPRSIAPQRVPQVAQLRLHVAALAIQLRIGISRRLVRVVLAPCPRIPTRRSLLLAGYAPWGFFSKLLFHRTRKGSRRRNSHIPDHRLPRSIPSRGAERILLELHGEIYLCSWR